MENIDGKININIFDDGFWENLNTRSCRSLDTIYLPDKQVEMIKKDIGNFLNDSTKQRMTNFGIPYKRNFLFEGRCGTGKTSFIMALASEFKHDIAIMSFHEKLNDIQLMRALRSIPDDTFLVLEDIDSLFVERKKNDEFRNRISFSGLLNILDGMAYKEGLITFMTTNHKLHLDPALIRAGRVDKVLSFDYAKKEQFKKMVTKFTDIQDKDKFKQFWDGYRSLGIKITTSLLQQYLIQYLDETDNEERYHKIIKNVELIKEMHDDVVKESKNLYT
jgi:chaperone BCS1